jgi:hypothetical protein
VRRHQSIIGVSGCLCSRFRFHLGNVGLNRLEVDHAVFYAILLRGWQVSAGAVTAVLITFYFTRDIQGFYYTFASLIAMQTFFELGLNIVVINIASHEWAALSLDVGGNIVGDTTARSRLVSLGRLIFKWYGGVCSLFVIVVATVGILFLSGDTGDVSWQTPWVAMVVLSGLLLWTLLFCSLLEGCNQVATVNQFRIVQAVCGNAAVWAVMILSGNLWAAVAAAGARLLCNIYLLTVRYGRFFRPFFAHPSDGAISWRTDFWPCNGDSPAVEYSATSASFY